MTSHPNQLLKIEELVEVLKRKHFGKGMANIWSRFQSGIRLSKHGGATKEERCLDFQLVIGQRSTTKDHGLERSWKETDFS